MVSQIKVNEIIKQSGSSITIGESGDTVSVPSGATLNVAGSTSGLPNNTPAFSVWLDSTQAVANTTATKIIFNDEDYDTDSAYDTSNGRFTVPTGKAGKYVFTCSVQAPDMTDGKYMWVRWYVNGSNTKTIGGTVRYQGWTSNFASSSANLNMSAVCQIDLSEGDYVELYMYHNRGSSFNLDIETQNFAGYKLV
tara:strand:+ start:106 stop:687 length:582 start_codon:yes stop_codon:yes gene_type:complete